MGFGITVNCLSFVHFTIVENPLGAQIEPTYRRIRESSAPGAVGEFTRNSPELLVGFELHRKEESQVAPL